MSQLKRLETKDIEDIFALTPMQEGMLFHYLRDPGSDLYFEQLSLNVSGEIEIKIFEQAWNFVVQANEMLRTCFRWEKLKFPAQVVLKQYEIKVRYFDISTMAGGKEEKRLAEIKLEDKQEKFNLREVPFRLSLCKIGENRYEMIISNHHILYDGWSNGIILREFFGVYQDLSEGKALKLPAKTKFKEFVKWLRHQESEAAKQAEFWKEYLAGFKIREGYPANTYKRREITGIDNYNIKLPGEVNDRLTGFIKNHGITIASVLYSVWGILLQHYNVTNDVLFDTTVSGRSARVKEIENMVGLFINTLPLRVQSNPGEKISDFLTRMFHMLQRRRVFENNSPISINEYLHKYHNQHLFDSLVVLENYPLDRVLKQENARLTVNSFSIEEVTSYDLTIIVTSLDDIKVNLIYDKNRFDEEFISHLADRFIAILREFIINPGKTIAELEPLSAQEKGKAPPGRGDEICRTCLPTSSRNGKDNRKMVESKFREGKIYDEMEMGLVRIWEEVLGKRPGPDENFFEIGGNSLELVRIYKQVNERYPGKIKVSDFFSSPTIRGLKELLISKDTGDVTAILKKKRVRNINF